MSTSEVNDVPSFRPHLTSLALPFDLDFYYQRSFDSRMCMCRNGDCKLRFSACDLLYARVCYDMSAHARNTSIEPLSD
jgi:hypothetical protein